MPKKEAPINALQGYLPSGTYEPVLAYLQQHKVHLTITRERKTLLGDYRHRYGTDAHRISVNGNLNIYSFLITLLHELAHLLAFERFGPRVASHGKEWKALFGSLLEQFVERGVFPVDIRNVLLQSLQNPAASSCADEALLRVLRGYDAKKSGVVFVEALPDGALFRTSDGRVFQKGAKLRKRFKCTEVKTKKVWLFSAVYEVEAA